MKLQTFLNYHQPRINAYRDKNNNNCWYHKNKPLTDNLIQRGLSGEAIAYFTKDYQSLFSIDIDVENHSSHPILELTEITNHMKKIYYGIIDKIPLPSTIFKSPKGMHAYWYLKNSFPIKIIKESGKALLGKSLEFLPTPKQSLRIPRNGTSLHTSNLYPINDCEEFIKYSFYDLFPKQKEIDIFNVEPKEYKSLAELENEWLPLKNKKTNNAIFLNLLPVLKRDGYSKEQALDYIIDCVTNSLPQYTGDLLEKKGETLKKRVYNFYSKNPSYQSILEAKVYKKYGDVINNIIKLTKEHEDFSSRKFPAVKKVLIGLLIYKLRMDEIFSNQKKAALRNKQYKYFIRNMKNGHYEIPSNFLRSLNQKYKIILRIFNKIDFLIPVINPVTNKQSYDIHQGKCKTYKFKINKNPA